MSPQLTRGQREYAGLMGSSPEEGLAEVRMRSPQMYDAVVEAAFGQMMAQAGLAADGWGVRYARVRAARRPGRLGGRVAVVRGS